MCLFSSFEILPVCCCFPVLTHSLSDHFSENSHTKNISKCSLWLHTLFSVEFFWIVFKHKISSSAVCRELKSLPKLFLCRIFLGPFSEHFEVVLMREFSINSHSPKRNMLRNSNSACQNFSEKLFAPTLATLHVTAKNTYKLIEIAPGNDTIIPKKKIIDLKKNYQKQLCTLHSSNFKIVSQNIVF